MEANKTAAETAVLYEHERFYKAGMGAVDTAELLNSIEPGNVHGEAIGMLGAMLLVAVAKVEVLMEGKPGDGQ